MVMSANASAVARAREDLDTILTRIESDCGKLVYLYLETNGGATVAELKSALDISQLRLYPLLRSLDERGFITRQAERYVVDN